MNLKKGIRNILLLLIGSVLFSCASQPVQDQEEKNIQTEEIHPILQLKNDKGTVFGNNVGDHYFIIFLPGEELKLDIIQGNLVFVLDKQLYLLNTNEISENDLKNYSRESILSGFKEYEADYIQEKSSSELQMLDDLVVDFDNSNKTLLFWGYEQPEELKGDKNPTQIQMYLTVIENQPYVLGINCPISDTLSAKSIQENMFKILANIEIYDEYIDVKKMKDFESKYYSKY